MRAIFYYALFTLHQSAETQQDEFHKITKYFTFPDLNKLAALFC
jgi:hypothetical protein